MREGEDVGRDQFSRQYGRLRVLPRFAVDMLETYRGVCGYLPLATWQRVVDLALAGCRWMPTPSELLQIVYDLERGNPQPTPERPQPPPERVDQWRRDYLRGRRQLNEFWRRAAFEELPSLDAPESEWLAVGRDIVASGVGGR